MNTLYKKNCNTGQPQEFYPITYIERVIDSSTGETLDKLLEQYNHIWLPFKNNSKTFTRQQVPEKLRRRGLWITYRHCNCKAITEWYNSDDISNKAWGDNTNWVQIIDRDIVNKIAKELVEWYKYSDKDQITGNIKNLFHWYGSTAAFLTHKNQGLIPLDSIAFLHTGQIYVQGHLIGVSSEEFEQLKRAVGKIVEIFGQGDNNALNKLEVILNFFEGFTEDKKLKDILQEWQNKLNNYVEKEEGKGLSTNDFTNELKEKLESLEPLTEAEIDEITK